MLKIHTLLIILAFVVTANKTQAQSEHFFDTRAGFEIQAQRDKGMSPLKYTGIGIYGGIGYSNTKAEKSFIIKADYSFAQLYNASYNRLVNNNASLKFFRFYHVSGASNKLFHLGWSNINSLCMRDIGSFGNYSMRIDYFTSFGPAFKFHYDFELFRQNFIASIIAHTQLFGFFIRPSLATNTPQGFINEPYNYVKGFFQSAELFYPFNAVNIGFSPQISYQIKSLNRISLSYDFDYYKLNSIAHVAKISGIWKLTLSTRLSRFCN